MAKSPFEAVAKAEDMEDLLDHIAWREVLRPELMKERENYTKLLVNSTLGMPVVMDTKQGPTAVTKEQLAGKIYGIDFIVATIEKILTAGYRAADELRARGLSLANYGSSGPSSNSN